MLWHSNSLPSISFAGNAKERLSPQLLLLGRRRRIPRKCHHLMIIQEQRMTPKTHLTPIPVPIHQITPPKHLGMRNRSCAQVFEESRQTLASADNQEANGNCLDTNATYILTPMRFRSLCLQAH